MYLINEMHKAQTLNKMIDIFDPIKISYCQVIHLKYEPQNGKCLKNSLQPTNDQIPEYLKSS